MARVLANDSNGKPKIYGQLPFKRWVKCKLCGYEGSYKCKETVDGGLILCWKTPNASGKKDGRDLRYVHPQNSISIEENRKILKHVQKNESENKKADTQTLNSVYKSLLESLTLSEEHFENLLNRGLSETGIFENLYASTSCGDKPIQIEDNPLLESNEKSSKTIHEIVQKLSEQFDLTGVPGFYFENDSWVFNNNNKGFYVPYRNSEGLIVGLQIRLDKPLSDGKKYLWLSSKDKSKGASPSTPFHFVNPDLVAKDKSLIVTEGALKADVIGSLTGAGVIALAGVYAKSDDLAKEVKQAFPDLEKVIVAFDSDYLTNEEVKKSLLKIIEKFKEAELDVFVRTWSNDFAKGFDDLLFKANSENLAVNELYEDIEADKFISDIASSKENSKPSYDDDDWWKNNSHPIESELIKKFKVQEEFDFDEVAQDKNPKQEINDLKLYSEEMSELNANAYDSVDSTRSDVTETLLIGEETADKLIDNKVLTINHESDENVHFVNETKNSAESKAFLGFSWEEFSNLEFQDSEKVIFGLYRGNVGQLVASTDIGKSTLALNFSLSALAGREFYPLVNQGHSANRILYIDGESTRQELQTDICKMIENFSEEEKEKVKKNLWLICDQEIDDEPLELTNPEHIKKIEELADQINPDLIIVDTYSALFTLEDENSNAEVKNMVIQPLKSLARRSNSAVLFLHHIGKYNEGFENKANAYKGRGASAFGAMSRSVFVLSPSAGKLILTCTKSKGKKFDPVVLELDQETRWFRFVENASSKTEKKRRSNFNQEEYDKLIEFAKSLHKPFKREEVNKAASIKISTPSLTRYLSKAVENEDLVKLRFGCYSVPEYKDVEIKESHADFAVEE